MRSGQQSRSIEYHSSRHLKFWRFRGCTLVHFIICSDNFGRELSLDGFTKAKIRGADRADPGVADWYPGDHPTPVPKLVLEGDGTRRIIACGLCHYPNGKGRAENASVSGLPVDYFIGTLMDMKSGARKTAEPLKGNANLMANMAKQMTDAEMKETAEYFGAITPWSQWIKVVESPTAPKVKSNAGLYQPLEGKDAGKEPIGHRIVEVPVNTEHTEVYRDPRSTFIAYVPPGSVAKGKVLVNTGGAVTFQCTACHGADLNGLAFVPGIASRSPSYLARQLNDYRQGTRKGHIGALMGPVAAKLSDDDIINITAYLASIPAKAKVPG